MPQPVRIVTDSKISAIREGNNASRTNLSSYNLIKNLLISNCYDNKLLEGVL